MPGSQEHGGLRARRSPGRPPITTDGPVALPEYELLARVYRTLGDPTRLRILETLDELGEVTQRELVEALEIAQPRVSEHISSLSWCGLVERRRQGRMTRYRLTGVWGREFLALARRFADETPSAVGGCVAVSRGDGAPPSGAVEVALDGEDRAR